MTDELRRKARAYAHVRITEYDDKGEFIESRMEHDERLFDAVMFGARMGQERMRDRAKELCSAERVRQLNGDRFEKLNGQDTAFALMNSIATLPLEGDGET